MWWLVQNIIFSVCLIVIIHYLYIYFETTLTSPKVKDLIHGPKQKYKLLLESIHKKVDDPGYLPAPTPSIITDTDTDANANLSNLGINTNLQDMKSDLKDYLREIASK
jgi:hypothetical protein